MSIRKWSMAVDFKRWFIFAGWILFSDVDYLDTWKAMEKLIKLGLVRSIGISNFNSEQIDRLLANCEIKPVNNQIEASLQINQKKLTDFCNERNIVVTAYCPLGRPIPAEKKPAFLYDDKVKEIADKYKKTPAQIAFRYLVSDGSLQEDTLEETSGRNSRIYNFQIQIGSIPIPKSVTKHRIEENINIFDFALTDDDLAYLDSFNTGERVIHFLESKDDKHFPFKIEF